MKGFFHKDTKFSRTLIICGLILVSILIFIGFLSPPEDNWFYFAFTIPALALGSGLLFELNKNHCTDEGFHAKISPAHQGGT